MRYATMEECLSRDKVIEEIKASLTSMSEEKQPFSFDDDRKATHQACDGEKLNAQKVFKNLQIPLWENRNRSLWKKS